VRTVFTNCLLRDGRLVDVSVRDGLIDSVKPAGGRGDMDMERRLVVPSFAEPHAHIDKAFLAERVHNPTNDLLGAIHAMEQARASLTPDDTYERAMRALRLYASNGISSVRSHADTMSLNGLESVRALLAAKRDSASFISLQVAMLLSWPVNGEEGRIHRQLAEDAIAEGIDVVGDVPTSTPTRDPQPGISSVWPWTVVFPSISTRTRTCGNPRTTSRTLPTPSARWADRCTSPPATA